MDSDIGNFEKKGTRPKKIFFFLGLVTKKIIKMPKKK